MSFHNVEMAVCSVMEVPRMRIAPFPVQCYVRALGWTAGSGGNGGAAPAPCAHGRQAMKTRASLFQLGIGLSKAEAQQVFAGGFMEEGSAGHACDAGLRQQGHGLFPAAGAG